MYTLSVDFGLLPTTCMCNSIGDYMLIYIYTLIISIRFVGIDVISLTPQLSTEVAQSTEV